MISHRLPRRSLSIPILVAVSVSAGKVDAQLEFAGIPWGTSQAQATERIRAVGYTLRGTDQNGDIVFGRADSVDLVAMFDEAGLVHVEAIWLRDPDRLPDRYDRMADSMRAVLGPPETETRDEHERSIAWTHPQMTLSLYFRPRGGGLDTALVLEHSASGLLAELDRRDEARRAREEEERANGRSDTTGVGDWYQAFGGFRELIRVDTVKYTRLQPQLYRARFRNDRMQSRRLPNGLLYTATVTEVELDCSAVRTRVHRTIPVYDGRATPAIDIPEGARTWAAPTAGSPADIASREACTVLGRQP